MCRVCSVSKCVLDVLSSGLLYTRAVCPSLSLVLSPHSTPLRVGGGFPSYTCCMLGLHLAGSRDSGGESYVTAQAARRGSAHLRVRAWVLVRPHTLSACTCTLYLLPHAPHTRNADGLPLVQGIGQDRRK